MDAIFTILQLVSYPINWILYNLKSLLEFVLPSEYAGFIAYYLIFSIGLTYFYTRLIEEVSIKTIYFENIGMHIVSLALVAGCGFLNGFTPSYIDENNFLLFSNMAIFSVGLFAIKSISYEGNIISSSIDRSERYDKFK